MLKLSNKIIIDAVSPEWFRRILIEYMSKSSDVTLQIFYNGKMINEYPLEFGGDN